MACNCENKNEKQEGVQVPYIVYEGEQARNERHIKRLIIALVIVVVAFFATNLSWLIVWCQYDYDTVDFSTSGGGDNNYVGNDGDINIGTNDNTQTDEKEC